MKIIVESEKEKQNLIKISRYLHDFRIYNDGESVKVFQGPDVNKFFKLKIDTLTFLDLESSVGNYLRHIYSTPELIDVK